MSVLNMPHRSRYEQLHRELEDARAVIYRIIDEDGHLRRWHFALEGERALKRVVRNLARYQNEFVNFNTIAEATLRNMPSAQDTLLPRTKLRCIAESWEDGIIQKS